MSTSELFVIRHKLLSTSFAEFKRTIQIEAAQMDPQIFENLALQVYENEKYRKAWIDYLILFAGYRPAVLHVEVVKGRRLLEDLLVNGKLKELRDVLGLMVNSKAGLEGYSLMQLSRILLERKNQSEVLPFMGELLGVRKYLFNGGEPAQGERDEGLLVKAALERELLVVAVELLQRRVGRLGAQNEQLFQLSKLKVGKRDNELLFRFVELYLEASRCNPRRTNAYGQTFLDRFASKEQKERIQAIILDYEQRCPPPQARKEQHTRRSQNKVRSSMGLGQHPKQYSTQPLQGGASSKQKMTISIQNMQDELSIQKEAGKIYQKHIQQKEKYYRYEKMQSREGHASSSTPRVGIIKSDQLRYYLEADIEYEVAKIKQENNRYRECFVEVLNRIREKLTNTLNIQLQVFGSFETSLCLLESDIDIVAVPNSLSGEVDRLTFLGEIKNILQSMRDEIQTVNYITTASVPIIKVICTAKYGHKKIDITKKTEQHNGLQSVKLIKEYLSLYPPLQSLTFILKKFIYVSGLSAPYKGGISSYALVLMIVAYMQHEYKLHELRQGKGELLVADLLIGFLKFYGFKMNYVMKAICLFDIHNPASWKNYAGCLSPYTDPKNPAIDLQPKLVIIDPLNDSNNVGRATHKIKQIQMAFQIAYICIHTFRQCGKKRRCESYKRINRGKVDEVRFADSVRPCCILRRMFACTEKFIKE